MKLRATYLAGLMTTFSIFGALEGAIAQEKPDNFPTRPINLVVMYPTGGAVDVTARTFAQVAEDQLGIDFRVENRVGGNGMVGHTYLAKSADADGHTIGLFANPFMFTDILLRNGSFSSEDFTPIATVSFDPVIWVVNKNSELGDLSFTEIIDKAKERPLQVGMNPNSMFLFVSEFVEEAYEVDFNYIPFDGGRGGVTALLSGDIDVTSAFYSEVEQYIRNGDLKAVAVTGDKGHPKLPDVPTFTERDVPVGGQAWGATRFFGLPEGVSEERKNYLADSFYRVLQSDEMASAFENAGLTLTPAPTDVAIKSYEENFNSLQNFLQETGRLDE